MCHLSQLEGLSLYHIVQWLLAAVPQGTVDEAAVGLPLLGVVPQRDGAPAAGHDIGLQKVRKDHKRHRAAHWAFVWQNEQFYQCMRRISQQSRTIFLPVPLLWCHRCWERPWLQKKTEAFYDLQEKKVLSEYAVMCNYLCFHILGGRRSRTALPGRSDVLAGGPASAPSCCQWESNKEDLGWTETRGGEGNRRETAAGCVSQLEELKKMSKREKKHIPLRSVERFPVITQDSLSVWSFLTHVSFSTINSSTSRNAAPTPVTSTSTDILLMSYLRKLLHTLLSSFIVLSWAL